MKSNVVLSIQNLQMSKEFMQDFIREHPDSRGANIFRGYVKRIDWIFNDILTYPFFSEQVREGMRNEIKGDVFSVPALFEKIPLLNPEQREAVESIVDALLTGEQIEVQQK